QNLVRDLGEGGFVALTMRMGSDANLDVAIRRDPDIRLFVTGDDGTPPGRQHRRSVRALLDEEGQANANEPPVALGSLLAGAHFRQADGIDGAAQTLRVIAAIEMLSHDIVERHLIRTDHVARPNLLRFESCRAG